MNRTEAQQAALELRRQLSVPSWRGGVYAMLRDNRFVIVVAADAVWRRSANIPSSFRGLEVVQEDQIVGQAYV